MSTTTIVARTITHFLPNHNRLLCSSSFSFSCIAAKPSSFSTLPFSKRLVSSVSLKYMIKGPKTTTIFFNNSITHSSISPFSSLGARFSHTRPNSSLSSITSAKSIYSHLNAMRYWDPPLRVSCIADEILNHRACECGVRACNCNKNHWLVIMQTNGLEFATEQALFDHYIKTLAIVLGSEEEARRKIYLVSCGWRFGFGTEIDKETKFKLEVCSGVAAILEDYHYHARNKNSEVGSAVRFTPINWNHRLNDIYSYYLLSNCQSKKKSGHWLIHIQEPDGGLDSEKQAYEFCAHMLAQFVGSEEDAKKKIYIVWCKVPFGFGAEIDEKTKDKLKDLPNVLKVLPDYAFDVKNKDRGVLVVTPSCRSESGSDFFFTRVLKDSDDPVDAEEAEDFDNSEDSDGAEVYEGTHDSEGADVYEGTEYSDNAEFSEDCQDSKYVENSERYSSSSGNNEHSREEAVSGSCCKHWFITMDKPAVGSTSMQQMVNYYIKTLTGVVGSENGAKGKIYRVTCEDDLFGFGAEIDEEAANKLKGVSGVRAVFPEFFFSKDHKGESLLTDSQSVQSCLRKLRVDLREWKVESVSHLAQEAKQKISDKMIVANASN